MEDTKQQSRNTMHQETVTHVGNPTSLSPQAATIGEGMGVSATHRTVLNERPNKSLTRNGGPQRAEANAAAFPIVRASQRNTGRV